ncbi:hypothetical protein J6590_066585 [Homalodisca vitripennis]|nr:hypothetical protein J6590_066585 [Homalodisca vitripennis]
MEVLCLIYFISLVILSFNTYDYNDTDSHFDKCKEFEKSLGDPNIFYDEENRLILKVQIYKGTSNRVLDSGVNAVAVRLKYDKNDQESLNKELVKYLSNILNIQEKFFNVSERDNDMKKFVKISKRAVKPYDIIDRLVAALEQTAREEPEALTVTDATASKLEESEKSSIIEEDFVKIFDWTNRTLLDSDDISTKE